MPLQGVAHAGARDASVGGGDISHSVQTLARDVSILPPPPGGLPDTISYAIGKWKGKTITVETPREFLKAIKTMEQPKVQPDGR